MDNPSDWRSAIDAKSGRTYWYHWVSRVTTWKMPDCLMEVQKANEDDSGYKVLMNMLDGLATPSELIDLLDKPPLETQFEVLKIIFNCCLPETAAAWTAHSGLIDKLSMIAIRTPSMDVRVLTLRVLFSLAVSPDAAQAFRVSKGWITIVDEIMKWNEPNTALLFGFIICLLGLGILNPYIPNAMMDKVLTHLQNRCSDELVNQDNELLIFIQHPNPKGSCLLDAGLLTRLLQRIGPDPHPLPSALFTMLSKYALRSQTASLLYCKGGGFSVLQSLCVNRQFPESTRSDAISLVRRAMSSSAHIQSSVLNSWIGLATDFSCTQEAPSDASGDPGIGASVVEMTERDVELRSTIGKASVKLHSVLLWSRCPGLRGIIEDLWIERRGDKSGDLSSNNRGMEIALEASDAVLNALHHYILTGILSPLPLRLSENLFEESEGGSALGEDLLELAKVSCELEMTDLELAVARQISQLLYWNKGDLGTDDTRSDEEISVEEQIALQRLEACMLYCEKWGLDVLSKFLATVQYYLSVETSMASETPLDVNDKIMILGDTGFVPMQFRALNNVKEERNVFFAADSPTKSRLDLEISSSGHEPTAVGLRTASRAKHTEDTLHEQVIASLEEISNVMSEPDRRYSGMATKKQLGNAHDSVEPDTSRPKTAPAISSNVRFRGGSEEGSDGLGHRDKSLTSYYDEGSEYLYSNTTEYNSRSNTIGRKVEKHDNRAPVTKAKAAAPANSKSKLPQRVNPTEAPGKRPGGIANRSGGVSQKKTNKGHGGMYGLLMSAANNGMLDNYELDAAAVDNQYGDYSDLYREPKHGAPSDEDSTDGFGEENVSESGGSDTNYGSRSKPAYVPSRTPGKVPTAAHPHARGNSSPVKATNVQKAVPAASRLGIGSVDRGKPKRSNLSRSKEYTSTPVETVETGVGYADGVYEYDPKQHSLGGAQKMSAAEKRLHDLAQPKSQRPKTDRKKKPTEDDDVEPSSEAAVLINAVPAETIQPIREPSVKLAMAPQATVPPQNSADLDLPNRPSVDVRESLKLLKSKRRVILTPSVASDSNSEVASVSVDLFNPSKEKASDTNISDEKSVPKHKAPTTKMASSVPTPIAPSDCTRSSGCQCSMCSMPISFERNSSSRGPGSSRFDDVENDGYDHNAHARKEPVARETELQKKRKAFNSQKAGTSNTANKSKPKAEIWKIQSQQFRAAIAAARGNGTSAVSSDDFKDANGVPFGMVHCDGCNRNFNPDSGARHMLVCKDIKAKPKMLVKGGGKGASSSTRR